MSGIVLSPNKLNPDCNDNLENNGHTSESDTVSDSEIENSLTSEKRIEIQENFKMYQESRNSLLLASSDCQPRNSNENVLRHSTANINLQNSTNTRFGNEINYHAPVTIFHSEIKQIYYKKKKWEYTEENDNDINIFFLIATIVFFSTSLVLIFMY